MSVRRTLCIAIIISLSVAAVVFGQEKQQPQDDVIRITTELVQAGVVVLDKQGRFVDGLKLEQFLLKVDGQPVTPTFFEHVVAGTAREEKLERSAGNRQPTTASSTDSTYRGRTIIFFIDDLHLSADSVQRTKKGILEFVEQEMSLEDQVAVVSPSGQIGFLQRFSDLKPVVNAAVNRLTYKPYTVRDQEQIPMTEYQAVRIEQGDSSAIDYFVGELQKANNISRIPGGLGPPNGGPVNRTQRPNPQTTGMTAEMARRVVRDRANLLLRQTESITAGTLSTLENLMRSVSPLPGRKIVFLVSDGFFLNDRSTGYRNKISRIANAAVHGGLVIYSVDARGLVSMTDAGSNRADPVGQLSRANIGEVAASQDGMNALAVDTGGKAYFNSPLTTAVDEGLKETSNYYLLAWRPTAEDQKTPDFKRLEVSIAGRPDLTVRVPRGFFLTDLKEDKKNAEANDAVSVPARESNPKSNNVESALMSALAASSSRTGMPTKLAASFVDVPGSGPLLTASTQISTENLEYGSDEKQSAAIDLAGVVLNDQGKQAGSFKTRINVSRLSQQSAASNPSVVYSHKLPLKPGIYQIRVAARDDKSGRIGSAAQWIEIPDLSSKKLTLSTLLLGGEFVGSSNKGGDQLLFSVDRRFTTQSQMTFLTIIYNTVGAGGNAPRLESQIEILRGGKRVIASPVRPIAIEPNTDLARIPYGGAVSLKSLQPGRYVLRVTINDRNANVSTFNQVLFDVE